jgi:peroxiredoxin
MTVNRYMERENILDKISNWPDLEVETLDGISVYTLDFASGQPILFNYFNTECIFCRNKIVEIAQHKELMKSTTIIFISDEETENIDRLRHDLDLLEKSQFIFLVDSYGKVKEFYGIHSVPVTYIYYRDGKLVQLFKGQIRAEILYSQIISTEREKNLERF